MRRFTDPLHEELRLHLGTIGGTAKLYAKCGYFEHVITMYRALIDGRAPLTVTLPNVKACSTSAHALARETGSLGASREQIERLDRCTDRLYELANDNTHFARILSGLQILGRAGH